MNLLARLLTDETFNCKDNNWISKLVGNLILNHYIDSVLYLALFVNQRLAFFCNHRIILTRSTKVKDWLSNRRVGYDFH